MIWMTLGYHHPSKPYSKEGERIMNFSRYMDTPSHFVSPRAHRKMKENKINKGDTGNYWLHIDRQSLLTEIS